MAFILTAIFVFIAAFAATILWNLNSDPPKAAVTVKNFALGILATGIVTVPFCVATIPANNVGIIYSPVSGVVEETLSEGWKIKNPLNKIYKVSTEVHTSVLDNITGQTKDSQYITMSIDVKYSVEPSKAFEVFKKYKTLENVQATLIPPTIQRSIEAVSTKYNVMDILGEQRNNLYKEVEVEIANRLAATGIKFEQINFNDTDAGAAIEKAIQDEAIAKKAVETAEQVRQKAQVEAQNRVVEANANKEKAQIEAETKKIEAQAAADVKEIAASAEAEANSKIAASITPELLQKMEMEARIKHGWVTIQGGSAIVDTRD